jgi:hypothetical protein
MALRALYAVLVLGIAICAAPLLSVIWAEAFARRHGCTLHEGFTNPCVVNGHDWGDTLYTAFVAGWLMLLTLPVGAALLLVLIITGGLHMWRRRRR